MEHEWSKPKINANRGQKLKYCFKKRILKSLYLLRPTLVGEELYTQMGFFVQTILADRYNHRRELRVVSLKSPSSVKYGILIFVFYRQLSRF